ncbi:hypothetical protein [Nostoc sp. DSM 114161]|uniref:hypothetical protein n=1 Tax=Nostoc sp. DSM 114161 TaxID=3440143 RepID=UPI0040456A03
MPIKVGVISNGNSRVLNVSIEPNGRRGVFEHGHGGQLHFDGLINLFHSRSSGRSLQDNALTDNHLLKL